MKNQVNWQKGVSETIEHKVKEQKSGFIPFLLDKLAASLLGIMLSGKGVIRAGEETIRAGQDFECDLIL